MKIKSLICLVILISFISISCGGSSGTSTSEPAPTGEPIKKLDVPRETPIPGNVNPNPATTAAPTTTSSGNSTASSGRTIEQKILAQLGQPASGDKIKDAFPNESFKVNFYREASDKTWTRLKVDLNRNEKWDEKWDLADGQLKKRQVASKDDENYDQKFVWQNGKWEPEK
ncbi:MAG: hypothetical protein WAQ98_15400 [Blastocatellia bacterium]